MSTNDGSTFAERQARRTEMRRVNASRQRRKESERLRIKENCPSHLWEIVLASKSGRPERLTAQRL